MKVVSGQVMQQMDKRAIGEFGIPGVTLMENAGKGCADAIDEAYGPGAGKTVLIVAGKGNNGGDGFVISRLLSERGWNAPVLLLAATDSVTGDAAVNLNRLEMGRVVFAPDGIGAHRGLFSRADVIVDALLGTGVKSEVTGIYGEAIDAINESGVPVVAVDIPSGVDAGNGRILGRAVRADITVSFALAKLGNVLYPGAQCGGRLLVREIGMPGQVVAEAEGYNFINAAATASLMRPRPLTSHKGSNGHCLVVAGSSGKTGAAAMSANSAVRTGSGLVTLAVPAGLNAILEAKSTEAMTVPLGRADATHLTAGLLGEILHLAKGKDVVALGPGIGTDPSTVYLVHSLAASLGLPLVIDADGLNAVAANVALLASRPGETVLTPHPGEMSRLTGASIAEIESDRLGCARAFATSHRVYLILKGARTVVAAPDGRVAINGSGNPGMASGGMGDVLTGVVASLVGQGYPLFDACCLGVFLHGHAADLAAARRGTCGLAATDVQEALPEALKSLTAP
ncbi:NAD(P)H-hydrate dehydratase [Geomonas sp. Red32]|uniref:NAD(P)H-hydrate dehydratase n=1 Tax=Geomonas sp. Red32 TaxID=2912856 RepID=UPI00202CE4D4|nr:NAD(P)H-hydrate dehydratase [Geomonas sp. Red32]MCM0082338.1 NAD(P)H-hydrate dehydratase [Geomonas sp. Red32]